MYLLNIIDRIYESSYFQTFLIGSIILLIVLFIIVLILGIKDSKKSKEPKVIVEEEINDVTFDMPAEVENIKEDVTFEMPVLTKNLEDFKKNLEAEIQKEDEAVIRKTSGLMEEKNTKPVKILDAHEIEDTAIVHLSELEDETKKEDNVGKEKNNKEDLSKVDIEKKATESQNIIIPKIKNEEVSQPKDGIVLPKVEINTNIEVLSEENGDNKHSDTSSQNIEKNIDEDINIIKKDSISYIYDTEDDF